MIKTLITVISIEYGMQQHLTVMLLTVVKLQSIWRKFIQQERRRFC